MSLRTLNPYSLFQSNMCHFDIISDLTLKSSPLFWPKLRKSGKRAELDSATFSYTCNRRFFVVCTAHTIVKGFWNIFQSSTFFISHETTMNKLQLWFTQKHQCHSSFVSTLHIPKLYLQNQPRKCLNLSRAASRDSEGKGDVFCGRIPKGGVEVFTTRIPKGHGSGRAFGIPQGKERVKC